MKNPLADKLEKVVIYHPKAVLLVSFLLTVVFSFGMLSLRIENSYDYNLPTSDPIVATNKEIESVFGQRKSLMIAVKGKNIFSLATLQKIHSLTKEIKHLKEVENSEIISLSTTDNIKSTDDGIEFHPFMKYPPKNLQDIKRIKSSVLNNELSKNRLVSQDGKTSIIFARLNSNYHQKELYQKLVKITEKYQGPEEIFLSGDPIMEQEIDNGIQSDTQVLLPIALTMVLWGFFLSFGSKRGVVLPFLVVAMGIIWTMGIMGYLNIPITVVSSALPMILVAIASSYGIHIVHRYYEEIIGNDSRTGTQIALQRTGFPILLTGVTSAVGAGSLIIFRIVSIKEFGIMSAIGILAATFISLTVVPAFLVIMKEDQMSHLRKPSRLLDQFLEMLIGLYTRRAKPTTVAILLITVISVISIFSVRVGNDFIEYFPEDHSLRKSFDVFNSELGGSRTFNIMVDGGQINALKNPEFLQHIYALQKHLERFEEVGYSLSYADMLKHMNFEMNHRKNGTNILPNKRDLISQYMLFYPPPSDFIDTDYQRARIVVMIKTSEQEIHNQIYSAIEEYAKTNMPKQYKVKVGGMLMVWIAQIRYIVVGKLQNIALALVLIILLCSLVYRSLIAGLFSVVPLAFSILVTFGTMGILGIRLDMATAIITGVAVGIGVDFSIHYILRLKEELRSGKDLEQALRTTGKTAGRAIIFDMLSNILGFIVFIGSGFLPIRSFGWLVSLTMATVGIGTLYLLPLIIWKFKPKFLSNLAQPPSLS